MANDASTFHAQLELLRRAHDAYQARGHRRYDPVSELAASEVAGRAEAAALKASLIWKELLPDILPVLEAGALLDRSGFRTLRAQLAVRVDGPLIARALRRLSYLQDWDATFFTVNRPGPAPGLRDIVDGWHHYRMWSIHSTAGSSRRVSEPTRTGAHLLHQSTSAAVFLAAEATNSGNADLASLAKTVLLVPPQVPV